MLLFLSVISLEIKTDPAPDPPSQEQNSVDYQVADLDTLLTSVQEDNIPVNQFLYQQRQLFKSVYSQENEFENYLFADYNFRQPNELPFITFLGGIGPINLPLDDRFEPDGFLTPYKDKHYDPGSCNRLHDFI
jgi:hypothetical protein